MSRQGREGALRDWRRPGSYRRCIWTLCTEEASEVYHVPICQKHVLLVWSLVEEHRQEVEPEQALTEMRERRPASNHSGWIYYLRVDQYIKIGYTKNLHQRMGQYPPNAELLAEHQGTLADEQEIHGRFAAYLETGREWYSASDEIMAHITTVVEEYGKPTSPIRRNARRRPVLKPKHSGGMKI